MTGTALALVIGAAVLHSAWNALAKRGRDQLAFLWSSVSLATLLLMPVWLWMLAAQGFGLAALPFVVATIILHAFYFFALGRAYGSGEFSTMSLTAYLLVLFAFRLSKTGYVVAARELSIVLSAIIGSLWLGEGRLAPRLAGAGVVLAGVACVAVAR